MIHIYPEELNKYFNIQLKLNYLIFGNDIFLIQKCKNKISKIAKLNGFTEIYNFFISSNLDWESIYKLVRLRSLFSKKQILVLNISDFSSIKNDLNKNLYKLVKFLHSDLIFIFCGNTFLTKKEKNSLWFKKIFKNSIYVDCNKLEGSRFLEWIKKRTEKISTKLNFDITQLLSYYYEGNLSVLNQLSNYLLIKYKEKKLTVLDIKNAIRNIPYFTPYQWIKSLLLNQIERSFLILKVLKKNNISLEVLFKMVQRELILIFYFKRKKLEINENIRNKFYLVSDIHYQLLKKASIRITFLNLKKSIELTKKIELELKKERTDKIWQKFEILSLLLCNNSVLDGFK